MSSASRAAPGGFTPLTTITQKGPDSSLPPIVHSNTECCDDYMRRSERGYLSSSSSFDSPNHTRADLPALDLAGGSGVGVGVVARPRPRPRIRQVSESTTAPTSRVGTPTSGKSVRPLPALPASPRGTLGSATWPITVKSEETSPSRSPRTVRPLPSTPTQSPLYTSSLDPETSAYVTSGGLDIVEPVVRSPGEEGWLGRSGAVEAKTKPPTYTAEERIGMKESELVVMVRASPPSPSRPVLPTLSIPTTLSRNPLAPPTASNDAVSTPLSPLIPQPPTPQTLRKRRLSKLRRHFGEAIPEEIMQIDEPRPGKGRVLEENNVYLRAAIAVGKILDIEEEDDESATDEEDIGVEEDEEEESDGESRRDYKWVLENGVLFESRRERYSRRWIREQGSRRWEEGDYGSIIKALRAL